jgi:hypothetical protein
LKEISMMASPRLTLIGGPSVLIELGGFRLLTDPTFDAPGEYRLPHVTLQKTAGPSINADKIGPIDTVLLSHDQRSGPQGQAALHIYQRQKGWRDDRQWLAQRCLASGVALS